MGEILASGPVHEIFLDVETLEQSYISPPQISRLSSLIADAVPGFPRTILTTEQMVKELTERISLDLVQELGV